MGSVSGPPLIEAVKNVAGLSGFLRLFTVEPKADSLLGEPGEIAPGRPRGDADRGRVPRGEPGRGDAGGIPRGMLEKGRGDMLRSRGDAWLDRRCTCSLRATISLSFCASWAISAADISVQSSAMPPLRPGCCRALLRVVYAAGGGMRVTLESVRPAKKPAALLLCLGRSPAPHPIFE
jgi:hypothetical protein